MHPNIDQLKEKKICMKKTDHMVYVREKYNIKLTNFAKYTLCEIHTDGF